MISARRHRYALGTALGLLLLGAATARAQDFPDLRGTFSNWSASSNYSRWDGLNFGGQIGVTNMDTDFGNSTSGLIAYILRNTEVEGQFSPSSWTTLPSNTTNGRQYGDFIGYNWQWDQLVVGFDLAYNRISTLSSSASDTIARQVVTTPDNVNNALTITTQSSLKMIDYGTMRARAGYAIGQFLRVCCRAWPGRRGDSECIPARRMGIRRLCAGQWN